MCWATSVSRGWKHCFNIHADWKCLMYISWEVVFHNKEFNIFYLSFMFSLQKGPSKRYIIAWFIMALWLFYNFLCWSFTKIFYNDLLDHNYVKIHLFVSRFNTHVLFSFVFTGKVWWGSIFIVYNVFSTMFGIIPVITCLFNHVLKFWYPTLLLHIQL